MKTKPLKALEPGFKKKTNSNKGMQIFLFTLYAVSAITFVIGTVISGRQYEKAKAENKQKDATIARQQLIIDTLKGDTLVYKQANDLILWHDTTSYIVDHSEIKRDQQGD